LDLLRRVVEQQGVGALVERDAAARREEAALGVGAAAATAALHAAGGQQLGDVGGLAVADRHVVGDQLGGVLRLQLGVGQILFVLGQLSLRRDPDDVAVAA